MSISRIPGPIATDTAPDEEHRPGDARHEAAEQHQAEEPCSAEQHRSAHAQSASDGPRQRSQRGTIPSEQDCLRMLAALNTLLLMGFIDPRRATAIRGGLAELLRHFRGRANSAVQPALSEADLAKLLQADPSIVDLVAPFLTEEQIAFLLRREKES